MIKGCDNDWTCPNCGNQNFAFRNVCNMRKCGTPKPESQVKVAYFIYYACIHVFFYVITFFSYSVIWLVLVIKKVNFVFLSNWSPSPSYWFEKTSSLLIDHGLLTSTSVDASSPLSQNSFSSFSEWRYPYAPLKIERHSIIVFFSTGQNFPKTLGRKSIRVWGLTKPKRKLVDLTSSSKGTWT